MTRPEGNYYVAMQLKQLQKDYIKAHQELWQAQKQLKTLESERACNEILTDELEVIREQLERYEKIYGII